MDLSTLFGLLVGFGSLILSVLMEGGELGAFFAPSALVIVFGGTLGATLIAFPLENVMKLPKLFGVAFKQQKHELHAVVEQFSNLAETARKQGLLALETESQSVQDPFTRQAIMMAVDGMEAETLRSVLEGQVGGVEERHEALYGMLEAMGGFAPTMGIIGTVMGLVHVLGNLSDPSSLGPKIAVAFIATLWGVSSANLLWLPLGNKLKRKHLEEITYRTMVIEGVLAVQAGENPRIVRQKLEGMVAKDPKQAGASEAGQESKKAA